MERFLGKRKKENIIIGAISLAVIIVSLIAFGTETIKYWLNSPLVWDDPDYVDVTLINKEESGSGRMDLEFVIENNSSYDLKSYRIEVLFGTQVVTLYGHSGIEPYSRVVCESGFSDNGTLKRLYSKLHGKSLEEIDYNFHIRELSAETGVSSWEEETLVENNGIWKIACILLISVIASIFVLKEIVKPTWLRIICKFLMVPGALAVGLIIFVLCIGSGQGAPAAEESSRKKAAENYKRQANLKAGAVAHGNTHDAAFAQAQMDKNLADMIPSNASLSLKNEYKRQAQLKAGFVAHGNQKEAAKCQAAMDRLMAEMIGK